MTFMNKTSKTFALLLTLIIIMSCLTILMAKPAYAQSATPNTNPIPMPSVPTFTLKFVDNSYNIPTTTTSTTDTYTGKQIVTIHDGYYVQNDSIVLSITNQPFTSYVGPSYNMVNLYNVIRFKGHFSGDWAWTNISFYQQPYIQASTYNQSGDNVGVVFAVSGNNSSDSFFNFGTVGELGGQVDFQVLSFTGYTTQVPSTDPPNIFTHQFGPQYDTVYNGQSSDWSNTQTISLANGPVSVSTSSDPTISPSPTVPELSWLVIVPLLVSAFAVAVIVRYRKIANFGK